MSEAAKVIPITAAKKGAQPAKKRRKRKETEQVLVDCRTGHSDLKGRGGVLTLDYLDGKPWDATFDPIDERVPNAVIPIAELRRNDDSITITSEDDETWTFAIDHDDPYEDCR